MRLLDAFIPVLAFVRQFVARPESEPADLSARIGTLLAAARQQALERGTDADEVREALFAVCAWTDEALLTSGWPSAADWQPFLLQRQHFGTSNAGVAFFEHLAALTLEQGQAEEVYLMCLALGFQGRYGHGGQASERDFLFQAALQRASDRTAEGADGLLFPAGYAPGQAGARTTPRPRWMPSRRAVAVVAGSTAVLCGMYAFSRLLLSHWVDTLLPQLR